ncbi:MAG: hypothetical protein KAJ29_05015 [Alphaproteobacteria bacterium]|nr:hypothetical protein [Alphaproteobacteria bacterium]
MERLLLQHHRLFLFYVIIMSVALVSLPSAYAADMSPAAHHIKLRHSKNKNTALPHIITGRSQQTAIDIPLPEQKPEQEKPQTKNEEPTEQKSVIKTLKFNSKTKTVKTTKKAAPLATPPEQKPAPRKIALPLPTTNYRDQAQPNDNVIAATSGQPFTNTQKDLGLASSLRSFMKEQKRDPALIDALYTAAQETGVSFELMTIKAMIESDLGTNTIAAKSSARGIFQYIDATWLSLIKRHGKNIGYANYANALKYNPTTKRYNTHDEATISRQDILDLRNNARTASLIKAYQIIDEQAILKEFKEGSPPTITDHYIMHMMGVPLSRTFFRLKNSRSPIILAYLKNGMFNEAIALNPSFFYDEYKNALSAPEIYGRFAKTTANKIDALRAIDKRYGNGENVTAQSRTPTPVMPRIHTPSPESFQSADISNYR